MSTSAELVAQTRAATEKLLISNPDHVPVIVEKPGDPEATMRFLVPRDASMGTILKNVRAKLKVSSTESIFLYVDKFMIPVHISVDEIYAKHHNKEDLRLYMRFQLENTFGA